MTKLNSWASSDLSEQNLGRAIYNDTISKKKHGNRMERRPGGGGGWEREVCIGKAHKSL